MGGRHTPIPLQFDAHGLNITSMPVNKYKLNKSRRPSRKAVRWVSVSLVELLRGKHAGLFFILTDHDDDGTKTLV